MILFYNTVNYSYVVDDDEMTYFIQRCTPFTHIFPREYMYSQAKVGVKSILLRSYKT